MKKVELRTAQFQLEAHGDEMRVSGVVNKPNEWSHLLGTRKKFRETICEGVFEKALKRAKKVDFLVYGTKDHMLTYPFKLLYNCFKM